MSKMHESSEIKTIDPKLPRRNMKLVKSSKWAYPLPKSKEYWEQFCSDTVQSLNRVRLPAISKLSYLPLASNQSRLLSFGTKYNNKPSATNTFTGYMRKMKALKRSIPNIIPTSSIKRVHPLPDASFAELIEQLSSHRPNVHAAMNSTEDSATHKREDNKCNFGRKELRSNGRVVKTYDKANADKTIGGKINYGNASCPYHRYDDPVRIFDDYIQDYLRQTDVQDTFPELEKTRRDESKNVRFDELGKQWWEASDDRRIKAIFKKYVCVCERAKQVEKLKNNKGVIGRKRIPKLLAASLQPSFAKIVSESFDEDYIPPKVESKSYDESSNVITKVFELERESMGKMRDEQEEASEISHGTCSSISTVKLPAGLAEFDEKPIKAERKNEESISHHLPPNCISRYICEVLRKRRRRKTLNLDRAASDGRNRRFKTAKAVGKYRAEEEEEEEEGKEEFGNLNDSKKFLVSMYKRFLEADSISSMGTLKSRSRGSSGCSGELMFPSEEGGRRRTSRLEKIPKMTFPRRAEDRCFACLHKPFESRIKLGERSEPSKRETEELSDGGDSTTIAATAHVDAAEKSDIFARTMKKSKEKLFRNDERVVSRDEDQAAEVGQSRFSKNEAAGGEEIDNSMQSPVAGGDLSAGDTELKKASSRTAVASIERSKPDSSIGEQTSDEELSFEFKMLDDPAGRSKQIAPCFLPVVFRRSLAPLRALKQKKPMTFRQMKEQQLNAMKKTDPGDDSDRDEDEDETLRKDKSRAVSTLEALNKQRTIEPLHRLPISLAEDSRKPSCTIDGIPAAEEKDEIPARSAGLIKVKSIVEGLTLENAEYSVKREELSLRRGFSCSNLETLKDDSAGRKFHPRKTVGGKLLDSIDCVDPLESSKDMKKLMLFQDEVTRALKEYLAKNKSSVYIVRALSDRFFRRFSKDFRLNKRDRIGKRLVKLLMDSKRYLHPDKFSPLLPLPHPTFSSPQPLLANSRRLRHVLGAEIYNKLAPFMGMKQWLGKTSFITFQCPNDDNSTTCFATQDKSDTTFDDLMVHRASSPDMQSLKDREEGKGTLTPANPYSAFLKKKRRKAVTWRPLTERDLEGYDPASSVGMRAKIVTDKICQDFSNWVKDMSDNEEIKIDEEVIRDMFEIDFSAEVCRAMRVLLKEVPTVPEEVAIARQCPQANELTMTRKHLLEDARAESKPAKIKGFGTILPKDLQFVPPKNQVRERWLKCNKVPDDLLKMDVVWKNITHLESVKSFLVWMENHPEVPLPEALQPKRLREERLARKKQPEAEAYTHLELELHQIESLKVAKRPDEVTD